MAIAAPEPINRRTNTARSGATTQAKCPQPPAERSRFVSVVDALGLCDGRSIWLPELEVADGFVVCPLDEVGRCELFDSLGVSTAPVVVEQFLPLAGAAAVEERSIALQDAFAGVGHEFVRSFSHRVETGRGDEVGEAVFVDVDVEPVRDASHLGFEISLQIRIVDEDDVRLLARFPKGGEVMHRPGQVDVSQLARVGSSTQRQKRSSGSVGAGSRSRYISARSSFPTARSRAVKRAS